MYVYDHCSSRLEARRVIHRVLTNLKDINFKEQNLAADLIETKAAGVRMSPTLVLDGEILCVGAPTEEELKQRLNGRLK